MKTTILILNAFFDFIIVLASLPLVRTVMIHSPLFDASAPQWQPKRYLYSGIYAAIVYFLLAASGGFYSIKRQPAKSKVPATNFSYFLFLFLLGLFACWRYAGYYDGAPFVSKRALLFALTISYFITTFFHYFTSLFISRPLKTT